MKKLVLSAITGALTIAGLSFNASVALASEVSPVEVTKDNYVQAESQKMFEMQVKRAGGVNKFYHYDGIPSLEEHAQIVRSNNDTVYSTIVVDKSEGATLIIPEVGDRYISILEVDGNHYAKDMQYGSGVKKIRGTTDHVFIVIRIGVKDGSEQDLAEIAKIQQSLKVNAGSANPVPHVNYDKESHEEIHKQLQATFDGNYQGAFGEAHEVDKERHLYGAATGWAGADDVDNVYQGTGNFNSFECHAVTFEDPQNGEFWSVTVYDKTIHVFSDNAHVSSVNAVPNEDGTYTVRFGCKGEPNNIDIENPTGEWTPMFRHYKPSQLVLDGGFNAVHEIKPVD